MDSAMASIRLKAPSEVLDYGFLMDCLKNYGFPRKKLTQLLKKGALDNLLRIGCKVISI